MKKRFTPTGSSAKDVPREASRQGNAPPFHCPERSAYSWKLLPRPALWGILALAIVAYINSFKNEFVYDDVPFILENESLRGWDQLPRVFTESYPPQEPGSQWRPLTALTLFWDALWGRGAAGVTPDGRLDLSPLPFHFTNLLLHLCVCLAVYAFYVYRWGEGWGAFAAGALFAVHPVHVEAVAAIVGRTEMIATLGVLTGLACLAGSDPSRGLRDARLWGAMGAFAAGLLGKESAAAFLPLAAACAFFPFLLKPERDTGQEANGREEGSWNAEGNGKEEGNKKGAGGLRRLLILAGWALTALAVFLLLFQIRMRILGAASVRSDNIFWNRYGIPHRFPFMLAGYFHYLRVMLWPGALSADYFFPLPLAFGFWMKAPSKILDAWALIGALALLLTAGGTLWLIARRSRAALCGVWWLACLLPAANLIPFGAFVADRLLYMPSVGICWLAGLGMDWALGRLRRGAAEQSNSRAPNPGKASASSLRRPPISHRELLLAAGLAIVLAALCGRTILRNRVWKNEIVFFETLIHESPGLPGAPWGLGQVYFNRMKAARAESESARQSGDSARETELLARAREDQTRAQEAFALSRKNFPDYQKTYFHEAWLLTLTQPPQIREAEKLLRAILPHPVLPQPSHAVLMLADILHGSQREKEAEYYARTAINLDKALAARDPRFREVLGIALFKQNRRKEALEEWRRAANLPGAGRIRAYLEKYSPPPASAPEAKPSSKEW